MSRSTLLVLLFFIHSINGLIPRKCGMTEGAENDKWLGKKKCYYCQRTIVLYMESLTKWKIIHEEAGCADDVDPEETPPGLDCGSHLGKNSSGRGSDFVMYFTARDETELIARRCCENFDGLCNRPFEVKYPQKYMMRHVRRSPPRLIGPIVCCIIPLLYIIFRIYYASRGNKLMSLDVTKKEQLKMFGYRDDNLELAIIENRTKIEEPPHAVRKANAIQTFNEALKAIFDIQYAQNKKKYEAIWMQALPKMRREAEMRGLRKPLETPPDPLAVIADKTGHPFYELKKTCGRKAIFTEIFKHQTMTSKILKTQFRPVPSCLPDLVLKLIEHGPYEYPFKAAELFQIFEKAKDQFAQDLTVLQLKNNLIVIGDIRGRYIDMFRYFNAFGWPPQRSYLFLGGIIENEEDQSLECMALLAALKTTMPNSIYILRGVGETVPYVPGRRFPGIKGEVVGNSLARMCNSLPVAAVISSRILCTHSGVTTHFKGKSRLNNIQRPFTIEDMTEAGRRIIFAVPETNCRMFRMRPHEKNGEVFGSKAVQKTLANMKLDLLIRSRSPIPDGYCLHWDQNVLSIWSALTHGITKAAAVEVDRDCRLTLHILDTLATLTTDKNLRVHTNNVKAAAEDQGLKEDGEDDEGDEAYAEQADVEQSSSRKKASGGEEKEQKSQKSMTSGKAPSAEEQISEKTASGGDKQKDMAGLSREKTVRDSKESKETSKEQNTMMVEPEKEEALNKTQESLSARATEAAFSDSMMEQKTQSIKEGKDGGKGAKEESTKKGKKKAEEPEKDKVVLKTPDISFTSKKEASDRGGIRVKKSPAKDDGKSGKKKNVEVVMKELDDAVLKSQYEDAIPLAKAKEEPKKDKQTESVMRDVSMRKKLGVEKDEKPAVDSLREAVKMEDKPKKKSNEMVMDGSKEMENPKDEYAISEESMGSKTHKGIKKGKKEEKKEKKEDKKE